MTDTGERPHALAAFAYSEFNASSIDSLVCRAIAAIDPKESAMTGSTNEWNHSRHDSPGGTYPVAGNSRQCTAKTVRSCAPSQNAGTAKPTSEIVSTIRPRMPLRTALSVPSAMPTIRLKLSDRAASDTVTMSRRRIAVVTDSVVNTELPRSPCSASDNQLQYCSVERALQPELDAKPLDLRLAAERTGNVGRSIAGNHCHEHEGDKCDQQQQRDGKQQPAPDCEQEWMADEVEPLSSRPTPLPLSAATSITATAPHPAETVGGS